MKLHRPTRPFGPHRFKMNGRWYLSASPSKKSVQRFKRSIASALVPANIDPWSEVCDQLNTSMRGWSNYFCYGTQWAIFRTVDRYIYERGRDFLARRHRVAGRGTKRFSYATVYSMGLMRLVASR